MISFPCRRRNEESQLKLRLPFWGVVTCLFIGALAQGQCQPVADAIVEQPEQIRLLFVGDTSFGENYQDKLEREGDSHLLKTRGYDYSLQQLRPLLDNADFTIANLETPITKLSVSPHTGKKKFIHWDNPTEAPAALQRHRIHAVSLANNHTLDFGVPGLEETFAALRQL